MSEKEPFVFISYSHTDKDFAVNFSKRLTRAGIKHFRDAASIKWGESIPRRVREGLASATHLVVLISPGSAESQWVAYEMGYAHGKSVTLVPYLLHPSMRIPGFISNLRCIVTKKEESDFIRSLKSNSIGIIDITEETMTDNDAISNNHEYTGYYSVTASENIIKYLLEGQHLDNIRLQDGEYAPINSFLRLTDDQNKSYTAVGRVTTVSGNVVPVIKVPREGIWSIHPRTFEEACAIDLLITDDVRIVNIFGSNRSRKRLLALAAGLDQVAERNKFNRLLILRPIIGLLANEAKIFDESGLALWMQPYFDNFELLLSSEELNKHRRKGYKELMAMGILEIEPLSGIFGRCLQDTYIVIDDVQGLTGYELKELFSVVGENTKLVLLSDSNLTGQNIINVVNKLKGQSYFGHLTLTNAGSEHIRSNWCVVVKRNMEGQLSILMKDRKGICQPGRRTGH